jgi:tetratricopeptide (TPR) repeat protein
MKRCPKCRRDFTDETLNYCLDDGTTLVDGPASGEAPTAVFGERDINSGPAGSWQSLNIRTVAIFALIIAIAGGGYWFVSRSPNPKSAPSQAVNDNYLRAKVLVANENRASIDSAIDLLRQVVKDDPQFAAGWAQLARALNKKAFYFANSDERKSLNEDAEVDVERSLTLDPNLAEGHFARGLILWTHAKRFPHELAVQSYKRAIELDPKLDEAHHQLALVYLHIGLFDKAQAEVAKALEINPGNTLARFRYGVVDLYRGKYDDAYQFFKSTSPDQSTGLQTFQLATAAFKLGRIDEAEKLIDEYLRENPNDEGGVATSVKAMILAQKGKNAEAEAAISRAEEIGRDFGHFHHTAYNIASAYAMLKKPDQAVDYLQLAADDGLPCYPLFDNDEVFHDMRQYPRYIALLAKLKQQWERYNATL